MKKIHLNFTGYWRALHTAGMPDAPGIYCVYACVYDAASGTLQPRRLLYTGEAIRVRSEVERRAEEWTHHVRRGEELCFTFAPIILGRRQAAVALSAYHDPLAGTLEPPFEPTELIVSGKVPFLAVSFRVEPVYESSLGAAG
jgi:hypothetical protein